MSVKHISIIVLLLINHGCTYESKCPEMEDWGSYELKETSKEWVENLTHNRKVVFLDSLGQTFTYTLFRNEHFYDGKYNCDHDGNGVINSGDPLVFVSHFQAFNIKYYGADYHDLFLTVSVGFPANTNPLTKGNFENNIFDRLYISIKDNYHQPAMSWIDKRNGIDPTTEYQAEYAEELMLGNRLFSNVYWDVHQLNNGFSKYIVYFNQEYGILGIKHVADNYLVYFDRFE